MVSVEYHCPQCGSIYDLEFCVECGYEKSEDKSEPKKFRTKKDGHREKTKRVRNTDGSIG